MTKKTLPPRLTPQEMEELAIKMVQEYVNACNCKSRDDVLLALSRWLAVGLDIGETVKHGKMEIVQ